MKKENPEDIHISNVQLKGVIKEMPVFLLHGII
jgi:hypothetical protein